MFSGKEGNLKCIATKGMFQNEVAVKYSCRDGDDLLFADKENVKLKDALNGQAVDALLHVFLVKEVDVLEVLVDLPSEGARFGSRVIVKKDQLEENTT